MKSKLLLASFFALAVAPMASADVELRITGATAFRAAVHAGLKTGFFNGDFQFAHSGTSGNFSGAGRSVWKGPVTGQGTVTIRCTWSGSITGIHSVAVAPANSGASTADQTILGVTYLTDANLTTAAAPTGGEAFSKTAVGAAQTSHIAFSDAYQASTIYSSPSLTDEIAGIIPFIWVVNDTSATGANTLARYGFDNITAQQARALLVNGSQPKSLLTGNAADTKPVYVTGRDIGSGTRVVCLAETGYGITKGVQHWQMTGGSDAISKLKLWPTGTYPNTTGNDPNQGNGGYTSGGTLAGLLVNKSDSSFQLESAAGTNDLGFATAGAHIVAFVGTSDAVTVVNGGGAFLKYEGSSYTVADVSPADGTNDDDIKIQNGQYTAWSNEHILYSSLTTTSGSSQTAVKDLLKASIETNIGTAGVAYSTMNVFRLEEAGIVAP
jgi:hypothetical protein